MLPSVTAFLLAPRADSKVYSSSTPSFGLHWTFVRASASSNLSDIQGLGCGLSFFFFLSPFIFDSNLLHIQCSSAKYPHI